MIYKKNCPRVCPEGLVDVFKVNKAQCLLTRAVNSCECKHPRVQVEGWILFQRSNKGLDKHGDALIASMVQPPAEENGSVISQFSTTCKAMYLRCTDCLCWLQFTVKFKGKKSIYGVSFSLHFCCAASGMMSSQPYPVLHSSCRSIRNFSVTGATRPVGSQT